MHVKSRFYYNVKGAGTEASLRAEIAAWIDSFARRRARQHPPKIVLYARDNTIFVSITGLPLSRRERDRLHRHLADRQIPAGTALVLES